MSRQEQLRDELAARFQRSLEPNVNPLTPIVIRRVLEVVVGALDQLAIEIDGPQTHMGHAGIRRAALLLTEASPWPIEPAKFLQPKKSTVAEVAPEPMPWERDGARDNVSASVRRAENEANRLRNSGSVLRNIKRKARG